MAYFEFSLLKCSGRNLTVDFVGFDTTYLKSVDKRAIVKPIFQNFIEFANHLTIWSDAFGQLCDIFSISGGHFSGKIKSFFCENISYMSCFVNTTRYLSREKWI